MNWELILSIASCLCTVVALICGYYAAIRKKIEQEALNAINNAEDTAKLGAEKMADAVEAVYSVIPAVAKPFISKVVVETIIQGVFDKVEEYARKQSAKK